MNENTHDSDEAFQERSRRRRRRKRQEIMSKYLMIPWLATYAFCGIHVVPEWGVLPIAWPAEVFYGICTAVGVLLGAIYGLFDDASPIAMAFVYALGGGVASYGCVFVAHWIYHERLSTGYINDYGALFLGLVGAIPGAVLMLVVVAGMSVFEEFVCPRGK